MPFKNIPKYYHVWTDMRGRCQNPNNKQYADYGGRGIGICERWLKSYAAFEEDMGERPENHSLDRIDNDLGYSPDNCRWANRTTQQRNQRRAVFVEVEGKTYRAIELAMICGMKTDVIVARAKKGLPFEQVISHKKLHNLSGLSLGAKISGDKRSGRTHCKHGHEYTVENTIINPDGGRICWHCQVLKSRRKAMEKRASKES